MAQYPRKRTAPRRNRRRLLLVVAGAVVVALALMAASLVSARGESPKPAAGTSNGSSAPAGTAEVTALLREIPQAGATLGRPGAPVTLVEYADLQCPYCAIWALDSLPTLVRDYVRSGKLRIEFRGLAFIGADSETALRTALAASVHGRLWNVVELLYANQGAENSGWVTDELLAGILHSSGLEPSAVLDAQGSAAVDRLLARASAQAQAANVRGTPSFQLGRTGALLRPFAPGSLDPAPFRVAIDRLLRS